MKKSRKLGMYWALLCTFATLAMTSCIKEDRDDCVTEQAGVTLRFRYTYNVTEGDAFGREADRVLVWIFDEGGRLLSQLNEEGEYIDNGFEMEIPDLGVGKYTFVAWAQETDSNDALANFTFPELQAGTSTLTDLHARLNREDDVCRTELNGLLCGTVEGEVTGGEDVFTVDMMKCTNKLRIILMPYRAGQQLQAEDYRFVIDGHNGWLDYKGDTYEEDPLTYEPYLQELSTASDAEAAEGEVNHAVVAELNTSRMMYEQKPRLRILNNDTGETLLDLNLTWFLSLQAIGEHRSEWSDQEYLDRQDEFAMTFFVDGDTFLMSRIIVNDWVLSLENVDLEGGKDVL
ncbi:protein of unknown function DUF1812 [Phocaeicola salanitronis DSM 18170]|uniref:Lipoprotein n=1 Tax=Phocaeicola salanitronis (strain DSM 18170 / JCM 13657 / CCUG 60908 / BL78) TaxID=667015 RepID=F0R534_PHOSB|nr:FimB/Mfa2 family fimbrial subunit [Phocaeicola salanitronis]ADY37788.1 protein of unknown function DUF1812 [Phocaeicola salanitronis DSM 18170]